MPLRCETSIEKVKAKVAAADPDPSKRTVIGAFVFDVTVDGKPVKKYTIDLKKLQVYEGAYKEGTPDALFTVDDDCLAKMLNKEMSIEDAKASGKLKSEGDADKVAMVKALVLKLTE